MADVGEPCPCCKECAECTTGFQKVVDLKTTGLVIIMYRHTPKAEDVNKNAGRIQKNIRDIGEDGSKDVFILHNTKDVDLASIDYLPEIAETTINCERCHQIIDRAHKLLQKNPIINKNDILGICDYCTLKNQSCHECQEIVKKFLATRNENKENEKERVKEWYSKVKHLLNDGKEEKESDIERYRSDLQIDQYRREKIPKDERNLEIKKLFQNDAYEVGSSKANTRTERQKRTGLNITSNPQYESDDWSLDRHAKEKYIERKAKDINEQYVQEREKDISTDKEFREQHVQRKERNVRVGQKALDKQYTQDIDKDQQQLDERGKIDNLKTDFRFSFPREVTVSERYKRQKSSSEIIKDTQDTLRAKAKEDKKRLAEEHKKKAEEEERKRLALEERQKTKVDRKKLAEKGLTQEIERKLKQDIYKQSGQEKLKEEKETPTPTDTDKSRSKESKLKHAPKESKSKPGQKHPKSKTEPKEFTRQLEPKEFKPKPGSKQHKPQPESGEAELKVTKPAPEPKSQVEKEALVAESKRKALETKQEKEEKERLKKEHEEQLQKEKELAQQQNELEHKIKEMLDQKKKDSNKKQKDEIKQDKAEEKGTKQKDIKSDRKTKENSKNLKGQEEHVKSARNKRAPSTTNELDIDKIKVREPSQDDLILQLVKMRQVGPHEKLKNQHITEMMTPFQIASHKLSHKGKRSHKCAICLDSDVEFDIDSKSPKVKELADIIIGQKIYKCKSRLTEKVEDKGIPPLLFQSKFDEIPVPVMKADVEPVSNEENVLPLPETQPKTVAETPRGVIRYALSDRTFIDKGWTMLPTEKVVRKMNVYRMRPAHPEFDWFKHNKNKRLMEYDTGERLAEFDDNGRGRWYYRNGRLALDYYDAEELNAQQRFVIYSSGEPDERGRSHPYTILATFDYLGNGIVFDHSGKIRLKYNQTEGVVLDRSIGPVSHWKWHTLNDPPVLQQVMIDTQMAHKDPKIIQMSGSDDNKTRPDNDEMLAIEFDNFIKEKSKKLSQSFKPFQIKMKALKINENFSLRVLDQATVYLMFRDGTTNLKLNVGMILDHKEIVDTDMAEVGEVSSNLERFPARTESLAGLQRSVAYAERFERARRERERRLRPPGPCASADELPAAASRPARAALRTMPPRATTTAASGDLYCKCTRKPSTSNVYYDNRLFSC